MKEYCDKCGYNVANASNVVQKGKLQLSFCNHHFNKYEQSLTLQGFKRLKQAENDDFIVKKSVPIKIKD